MNINLEEFLNKKFLSSGEYGDCYLIGKDGDRVLKMLKKPLKKDSAEKFKHFINFSNESFLFPIECIVYGEQFLGYIMPRSNGLELKEVFASSNLELFAEHSKKVEQDIELISSGKIIMQDVSSRNILYNKKIIEIIDPDFYKIYYNGSKEEVWDLNRTAYRSCITGLFVGPYLKVNRKIDSFVMEKINKYSKADKSVSELILSLKTDLENYHNSEINTLDDITNILNR